MAMFAVGSAAIAQDTGSKEEKAAKDLPGTHGGTTANPTSKPETGGKQDTESKDLTKGGTTANPEAKPETGGKHQ